MWALALGTPVLVVAGFGHLISLALKSMYKKAKNKKRSESQSISPSEKATASSRFVPLLSLSLTSPSLFPAHSSFTSTAAPLCFHLRVKHLSAPVRN